MVVVAAAAIERLMITCGVVDEIPPKRALVVSSIPHHLDA